MATECRNLVLLLNGEKENQEPDRHTQDMSLRIEEKEPLSSGIRRVIREQLEMVLHYFADPECNRHTAVHEARRNFKKIRALLRMIRPLIGEELYRRENIRFRDAGRMLAEIRDSAALVEAFDKLTSEFADHLSETGFDDIRKKLLQRHEDFTQRILIRENAVGKVEEFLQPAREDIRNLPVGNNDLKVISRGLKKIYRQGRNAMKTAYKKPADTTFHEWRKHVKYLFYGMLSLSFIWQEHISTLADSLHQLSDYLGDDHDLAEIRRIILDNPDTYNDTKQVQNLLSFIELRQSHLRKTAQPLGEKLYMESPSDFIDRIAGYWEIASKY
ncbi:MAG: CHAD domain-containing protein [bacterium]|jgi:CHAD domain-containing protein